MAINLAELLEGQKRLAEQQQKQTSTSDKMTVEEFKKLTETSKETVETLQDGLTSNTGKGLNSNINKMAKDIKKTNTLLEKQNKIQLDTKAILDRSGERKEFKSVGQRIGGIKDSVKDFFTMRGFLDKTGIVKRGTGGIFSNALDAREARQLKAQARVDTGERGRYAKGTVIDGKKVGGQVMSAKDSLKQFEADAKKEQELIRKQNDLQRAVDKKTKEGNLNKSQAGQLKESKELKKLAEELKKVDPESYRDIDNLDSGDDYESPSERVGKTAKTDTSETELENAVVLQDQLDTLHKIEENTRSAAAKEGEGESKPEESKGGMFSGIGSKMKGVGSALSDAAKGMIALAAAVWIISKAMQNFSEVSFGDFMMGIGAIVALTAAVKVLDGTKGGVAALLAMGAALWVTSKAFENFASLAWDDLMKGIVVIGLLGAGVAALGALGPLVLIGAGALLVMASAVWVLSKAFENISESMETFVGGFERLGAIGGAELISVAAGIAAIGAAMVAFGTGQAVAGLTNLVSGLLSIGKDSPIEQLEKISSYGPGIERAASGLERMSRAMNSFAKIDANNMKAAVSAANSIYKQSGDIKAGERVSQPTSTNVVSTNTSVVNNKQSAIIKSPIRNPESSISSFFKSRFVY